MSQTLTPTINTSPTPGSILFAPEGDTTTYLIDKNGTVLNTWTSTNPPGMAVHLWRNGNLLRSEDLRGGRSTVTSTSCGFPGGQISVYAWDGTLLWSYVINDPHRQQTHDAFPMPNGNVLACVWEFIPNSDPKMRTNCPSSIGGIWSGMIVELKPDGSGGATEVWQWRFWDHLLPAGVSAASMPQTLDASFLGSPDGSLGDWTHMNAVTYKEELHQIIVSSRNLNEVYIIEHCETTAIAAGGKGGRYGVGGDFLYRWGNPIAYGMGSASQQVFFGQHSPYWLSSTDPASAPIVVNNDGFVGSVTNCQPTSGTPNLTNYLEIQPPTFAPGNGNYGMSPNQACLPTSATVLGTAPDPTYQCTFQGSAQVLGGGNLLVCTGKSGYLFEMDAGGTVVWQYTVDGGAFRCHQYDFLDPVA